MSDNTVYLMLSGGVDSSVAAIMLQEQGFTVKTVFMQCWSEEQLEKLGLNPQEYACAWEEDARDAEWVANKLNLPFEIWDLREEYFNHVVHYMIQEYKQGKTPNPDIMCNSFIKFGVFSKKALSLNTQYVATGHYAQSVFSNRYNTHLIARGKDTHKDQSYFLSRVQSNLIQHMLFPVGSFVSKQEVRKKAEDYHLITANKPDSQGICFIGDTPLRQILLKTLGAQSGAIIEYHTQKKIGTHQGTFLYTIGQRHGLGIAGGPWFVHSIDHTTSTVYIVHADTTSLLEHKRIRVGDVYWFINEQLLDCKTPITAQIRYRQQSQSIILEKITNQEYYLCFSTPVRAPAPGQIAAIYDNDLLIASGIIKD